MEKNIYYKQLKMFDPNRHQRNVYIYGAGSIGSHVTIGLAKIGIKDLKVYDFDNIEESNKPAQFYSEKSSGKKTDALKEMVYEMTRREIQTEEIRIDEGFEPKRDINGIHILAFDNIEARKIIFNKLKGFHVWLIDGRIGSFNYEKYTLHMSNEEQCNNYEKTLDGAFSELECGEKCLWAVNSMIASKIVADVIKIHREMKVSYMAKGSLMADLTISRD